jgi:hypothetical protein
MNKNGWDVWNNLTFKTQGYRKNFDLVNENDNIITEYNGTISELKIAENVPPKIIGEYGLSTINIDLGATLNVDFNKLLRAHRKENTYVELTELINQRKLRLETYCKVVLIHGLVVHPDFRKLGVTEEFMEMIYRDFYGDNVAIIALVKPVQDNVNDAEYYFKIKNVRVYHQFMQINEIESVPAMEYYRLNELMKKKDTETNEYKLFSVANRCGFTRISENHLFILNPDVVVERIKEKLLYNGKK